MSTKSANILTPLMHRPDGLTDKEFKLFKDLIYENTGIHLSDHKRALIYSRLGKRLRNLNLITYMDYYEYLINKDKDGVELTEMINAITTNKTSFFREDYHFKFLREELFPEIISRAKPGHAKSVNIWSAGCSSGEEPYTIAMTLAESFPEESGWNIKLIATDIDTNILDKASNGVYPIEHAEQIPKHLLTKYFQRGRGDKKDFFRASNKLRSMINFKQLNLLDPVWSHKNKFDIIFCRNVIIYFDKPTQKNLISRYQENLVEGGYLMLGHSESLHGHDTKLVNKGKNIYQNGG